MEHFLFLLGASSIIVAWFMQVFGFGVKDVEHKKIWLLIGIGLMLVDIGIKYLYGG